LHELTIISLLVSSSKRVATFIYLNLITLFVDFLHFMLFCTCSPFGIRSKFCNSLPDSLRDPAVESERFRRDLEKSSFFPDIRDMRTLEVSRNRTINEVQLRHWLHCHKTQSCCRYTLREEKRELKALIWQLLCHGYMQTMHFDWVDH